MVEVTCRPLAGGETVVFLNETPIATFPVEQGALNLYDQLVKFFQSYQPFSDEQVLFAMKGIVDRDLDSDKNPEAFKPGNMSVAMMCNKVSIVLQVGPAYYDWLCNKVKTLLPKLSEVKVSLPASYPEYQPLHRSTISRG